MITRLYIAAILGLVQGLTEFIPVSSSGHLEIVQQFFGERPADFHYLLEFINIGTLLALIIYYRKRIVKILKDIFIEHNFKLALNVILTCIPAGLLGLALSDFIEENSFFSSFYTIGCAMGVVGLLMIHADNLPHLKPLKDENELTKSRALAIGCAQAFALIPGVSRSGSTIIAGRLMGLDSKSAADYSFLVSIPLMTAVVGKTFISSGARAYLAANLRFIVCGNIVAFVSGLAAIYFIMKYLKKPGALRIFGYYRVILAMLVLIFTLVQ